MAEMDTTIIIIISVVGGALVLLLVTALIVFLVKHFKWAETAKDEISSTSESSEFEHTHEHIETVSGSHVCCNHYPEWVYNDLKKQLLLTQKAQREGILTDPAHIVVPYESNKAFEIKDETPETPREHRLVEMEEKIEALAPIIKPTFHVPYLKKELVTKKQEVINKIEIPLDEDKDFDPFKFARPPENDDKAKIIVDFPKNLKVKPIVKPDKSQALHYENPQIAKRLRKEQLAKEAVQQEVEVKRKSRKLKLPSENKVEMLLDTPPPEVTPGPKKRILMDTNHKTTAKENMKLDSFLF